MAGSRDLLWGGLVIFLVAGTGAAGPVAFRRVSGPAAMLAGCLLDKLAARAARPPSSAVP